jgi:hypothetical protein
MRMGAAVGAAAPALLAVATTVVAVICSTLR